jgi:hypothetical protein
LKRRIIIGLIFYFLFAPYWVRTGEPEETIIFRVKIVVDQFISAKENWPEMISNLAQCINDDFKKQGARVQFEVAETATLQIKEDIKSLRQALNVLMNEMPRSDYDLVIGLTDRLYDDEKGGYYSNPGYAVIRYNPYFFVYAEASSESGVAAVREKSWTMIMIMHEAGHFFGLPHLSNPESIMHDKRVLDVRQDLFLKEEIESINKMAPVVKKEKTGAFR